MLKNFLILTLKGLRHRPLRSWLTILGIVIGIMLVVVIFSLGAGIKNAVSAKLQMFGSDLIILFPGKATNPLAGLVGGAKFNERDLLSLEEIPGIKLVVPMDVALFNIEFNGEKKSTMIHGGPWKGMTVVFTESKGIKLESGSYPQNDDANETVLGYLAANELFKSKVRVGDEVIIKSKRLRVAGIMSQLGIQDDDNTFYISLNLFRDLTGEKAGVRSALIKTEPNANIDLIDRQIKYKLSTQEEVRDFSVLTPQKANDLVGSILSIIELVLLVIAIISLVVGAIGIMNTMYTSVLERTKQIGVMKAVGASSDAILSLFLIESGIIGGIGGIFGIISGLVLGFLIGLAMENFGISGLFNIASIDFYGLLSILIITFITGVLAGVLPARQAAKMEPAEALRYE